MAKLECKGEIVLRKKIFDDLIKKLGLTPDKYEGDKVKFDEVMIDDDVVNVKFSGDVNWADGLSGEENPVDWLAKNSLALVWDVPELRLLEVRGDVKLLKFYSEEDLEKKKKEYTGWWMDSIDNISGLLG